MTATDILIAYFGISLSMLAFWNCLARANDD
jgi:hypothetical protein